MHTDDEISGAIYTALEEKKSLCSVQDLCCSVPGLKTKQDKVTELLEPLIQIEIVTKIGNKFILTEYVDKLKESMPPTVHDCEMDGLTGLCSDMAISRPTTTTHNNGAVPKSSQKTNTCIDNSRTVMSSLPARQHASQPLPVSRATESTQALVPRNVNTMAMSEQTSYGCDAGTVQVNIDNISRILKALKESPTPLKAAKVAQSAQIGMSRSSVNKYLYLLQKKGLVDKSEITQEWKLISRSPVADSDIMAYSAELAKQSPGKDKSSTATGGSCPSNCTNAGPNCNHYHIEQHVHNTTQNIQVGDHNQIFLASGTIQRPPTDS